MAKVSLGQVAEAAKATFPQFFNPNMGPVTDAVSQALLRPLKEGALPDVTAMTHLADEGYLPIEMGYTVGEDGSLMVAVKTEMPQVTPPMWDWWFGWHGSQDKRYKLWHPVAHVSARWEDGGAEQAYIGRTSIIQEYIGEDLLEAAILFKSPLDFGFSFESVNGKENAVYICAKIGHPRLPVDYGYLVHQIRRTENGSEMRSRFWLGGKYVGLRNQGKIAEWVTSVLKNVKSLPENFAPNLLRHCAEEMSHLAGFLPDLYKTYHEAEALAIGGKTHTKDEVDFEKTMFRFLYNQQRFNRIPDMIAEPQTVEDVIAIVRYAKQQGKKLTVLSGGRSFSANAMRANCLVISMKHFNQYVVDKEAMTATAGPGVGGSNLMKALYKQDLFFPAGHCEGVCLGGYLLQGGYGWNGRKLGIACKSVLALDLITADGDLVHASESENADLFWAARGAGAGFFGVIVKFYLKLYPLPKYRAIIAHDFAIRHLEDVYRWAYDVGPQIPKAVEFQMLMSQNMMNLMGPGIEAFAPIFADTQDEFEEAKQFMERSPIKKKALIATPAFNPGIEVFYKATMAHYPADYHYGVDNMWTHASIDDLLPYIKEISQTLPPAPSHFLWLNWYPDALDTDMAYSKEDNIYMALYSCWKDQADTALYTNWASEMVGKMQHFSSGIQLADEGLHKRTDRFMSDQNFEKLQAFRRQRDPEERFWAWHSAPEYGLKKV